MTGYNITVTIDAEPQESTDDCAHANLMGVIRRALENSPEFAARYPGRLVGLVAEVADTMSPEPYRSGFRVPCTTWA